MIVLGGRDHKLDARNDSPTLRRPTIDTIYQVGCDPVDAYEGTGERVYGGRRGWQRTQASPPHAWAASSITEAVLATMRWASASLPCSRRKACKQPSCARIAGARSPCTAVLVDDRGERLICTYNDPALDADATWLPIATLVDVVLADVRWPEGAARALAAARAAGVPAVLDGDVAPAATLRELCRCCDYAIFSHPGLSLASGAAAVGEGLRRMQKIAGGMVGVTLGADGFLWLDAGHEQRARPPRGCRRHACGRRRFHAAFPLAIGERRAVADAAAFERTLPDSASGLRERATRARSAQAVSLAPRCRRRSAKACGCFDPSCAKS